MTKPVRLAPGNRVSEPSDLDAVLTAGEQAGQLEEAVQHLALVNIEQLAEVLAELEHVAELLAELEGGIDGPVDVGQLDRVVQILTETEHVVQVLAGFEEAPGGPELAVLLDVCMKRLDACWPGGRLVGLGSVLVAGDLLAGMDNWITLEVFAVADAFDSAGATIDKSRSALLRAIAQAGTAGRTAYEAGEADLAAQRTTAVRGALAAAATRGAPAALQDELTQTIAQPYDRGIASLRTGAASRAGDLAARQANSESYLGEVSAAIPVARGLAERQLAKLRAEAAEKAADRAAAAQGDGLARDKFALDREKFEWEKSQGAAGGGTGNLSDAELNNRLLGVAGLQQERDTTRAAQLTSERGTYATNDARRTDRSRALARINERQALPLDARARNAGVAAGIDPIRVHSALPPATAAKAAADPATTAVASKAGINPERVATVRSSRSYKQATEWANKAVTGLQSLDDLKTVLNAKFYNRPDTIRLILAEYAPRLVSATTAAAAKKANE